MGNIQVILSVFSEPGLVTDQMRRVREGSRKDDSLGSPLSWVARCEGKCYQMGSPRGRRESTERPKKENFKRERMIPQNHMLQRSLVK